MKEATRLSEAGKFTQSNATVDKVRKIQTTMHNAESVPIDEILRIFLVCIVNSPRRLLSFRNFD